MQGSFGARRQLRRAVGAGESLDRSILRPDPHRALPPARATRRPPGSVAPLSLSRLRRCLPRQARGRAGRRGGARRSESRGGRGPGAAPASASSRDPRQSAFRRLSELGDQWRPLLLTPPPKRPRAQKRSGSSAPPHGGGGAEAQRTPEEEERCCLPGWAAREQEKKLFPPAPNA